MRRSLYFRSILFEIFGQVLMYQFQLFYFLLKGNVLSMRIWLGLSAIPLESCYAWVMKAMRLFLWTWKIINRNWKRGNEFKPECSIAGERWEAKEKVSALRSVNRYILEEFSQGNSGWYKNTSAETVTEEILSSGIGKKYLDTIIKRLAGLYTNREDIVNRFALLSGIVGRFRRAFVQMMKQ